MKNELTQLYTCNFVWHVLLCVWFPVNKYFLCEIAVLIDWKLVFLCEIAVLIDWKTYRVCENYLSYNIPICFCLLFDCVFIVPQSALHLLIFIIYFIYYLYWYVYRLRLKVEVLKVIVIVRFDIWLKIKTFLHTIRKQQHSIGLACIQVQ